MTVEVAVMNRMAVALAADSAVTVTDGNTVQIHDSAIKIFMLSKHHPVGVMIYNDDSLLGVPWETIIKLFRRRLGDKSSETIEKYGEELIGYLNGNQDLFPPELQENYYLRTLKSEYEQIARDAEKKLIERIQYDPRDPEKEWKTHGVECAEAVIQSRVQFWREQANTSCFDEALSNDFLGNLSGNISDLVLRVFEGWPIDEKSIGPLQELSQLLILKDYFPHDASSGVVIAGFGEREHFPALQHFLVGGIYGNKLKFKRSACAKIAEDTPSIVEAFAYTEMVQSFLYGIPSKVLGHLEEAIGSIRETPVATIDIIDDLSPEQQKHWRQKIRIVTEKQAAEFSDRVLYDCALRKGEILQEIASLRAKDLAQVASTLVSLSSFQKRMSFERETVGGPIDVAVISKGDGFIWIDRKHYFRSDLNQHFFENYFNNVPADEGKNGRISNKKSPNVDGENN